MTDQLNREGFRVEREVLRVTSAGMVREEDAAKYLGCSTRKMRKMREKDEGPSYCKVTGRIWYPLEGLNDYLDACRHETSR